MNKKIDQKTLQNLFESIPVNVIYPDNVPDIPITGIVFDSRSVEKGNVFVALTGDQVDGHQYISAVISRGAAAIVGTQHIQGLEIPYIQVSDTRNALAYLSAAYYDFPARRLTVIGVTGTDGKTTTSNLIYQILRAAGIRAGMISTVNAVIGDDELDTGFHVTTPEAPFVQKYLHQMVQAGLTHVVIEATSHGLAQKRVGACEFDIAVVTNITHEHLDYHGTYEKYRAAKSILFHSLAKTAQKPQGNPRLAVLNKDDISYQYLDEITGKKVTYGISMLESDYRAVDIQSTPEGICFLLQTDRYNIPVKTTLLGDYNVSNCLAAFAATVSGLGIEPKTAAQGIANLSGITGRMQRIHMDDRQQFLAIVDFAHTPNALHRALGTARKLASGRVIAVFGSAGLRDREKRRLMAEVSIRQADVTILTAEDPRTESLDKILDEMADAASSNGGVENKNFWRIPDRGEAIFRAVSMAEVGDVVIACGKGHEQSMCFGETEYAWDEKTAMQAAIARLLGISGPTMPYLPTQK